MTDVDEFWNFLGSWFPDADLEGIDDDLEVVRKFLATKNHRKIQQVYSGCLEVLAMSPLPVARIEHEANRCFDTEAQCRQWLQDCCEVLRSDIARD